MLATLVLALLFQAESLSVGVKALEAQKYPEAIAAFQEAVKAAPNDYAAHFHLALAYSLAGRPAEAVPEYRRTLQIQPGLYEAELNLGQTLLGLREPNQAIPLLAAAVEKKPELPRPVYLLAEALLDANRFADAEVRFRRAIALDAKLANAHLGLGRALLRQGKLDESEAAFDQAGQLDAGLKDQILELAAAREKAGQNEAAARLYERFPDNVAAKERAGQLKLQAGNTAAALPDLEAAVERSPTPANRYALAIAYIREKQLAKAGEQLGAAVQAEPKDVELRLAYGRVLRDQRQFDPAIQQMTAAARLNPERPETWSELAGLYFLSDRLEGSLAALDNLRKLRAEQPGHIYLRALALDRLKQVEPALASYQEFLKLSAGKNPDEEWKARQRVKLLERMAARK